MPDPHSSTMNFLVSFAALNGLTTHALADTIDAATLRAAPVMDGRVAEREYGDQPIRITTAAGVARVWLARHDGFVYGPNGWWSWPEPASGTPAQRVERSPQLWTPIRVPR